MNETIKYLETMWNTQKTNAKLHRDASQPKDHKKILEQINPKKLSVVGGEGALPAEKIFGADFEVLKNEYSFREPPHVAEERNLWPADGEQGV